jgi:hypothetical protein
VLLSQLTMINKRILDWKNKIAGIGNKRVWNEYSDENCVTFVM